MPEVPDNFYDLIVPGQAGIIIDSYDGFPTFIPSCIRQTCKDCDNWCADEFFGLATGFRSGDCSSYIKKATFKRLSLDENNENYCKWKTNLASDLSDNLTPFFLTIECDPFCYGRWKVIGSEFGESYNVNDGQSNFNYSKCPSGVFYIYKRIERLDTGSDGSDCYGTLTICNTFK